MTNRNYYEGLEVTLKYDWTEKNYQLAVRTADGTVKYSTQSKGHDSRDLRPRHEGRRDPKE